MGIEIQGRIAALVSVTRLEQQRTAESPKPKQQNYSADLFAAG
ncbi:MAG: hypothetical protein H6R19_216 [Proteobacteria bacterium]|nr:hypothetical protein [Pseudomonadota bacterium]